MTFLVPCCDLGPITDYFPLVFPPTYLFHFSCEAMPKNSLSPEKFQPSKEGEFSRGPFNKNLVPLYLPPPPNSTCHLPTQFTYQKSLDSCSEPLGQVLDPLRHYGLLLNLGCVFRLGLDCSLCSK